jgi:multidrug efflux system membrane fusion protein
MKTLFKILLPLVVLAAGAAAALQLAAQREVPEPEPREVPLPSVRTVLAEPTDHEVWVTSRGTVVPRTESQLVVEVPGRVVRISPDLVSGGFFEAGEVLLEIDPRDLELAVAQAELDVARSRRRLAEEEADAEVARREWETLGTGEPTPLTLREPQVAEARAQVAAAEALLERARRDLARTRVTAPFSGRVRDKRVDLGQYVQPGTPVATLYATDVAEVRLPLADGELAFVELPVAGLRDVEKRPEVELVAHFAGDRRSWTGRVVRTEGEIDPRTRMVMTVAEVREPYDPSRVVPLAIGMFVEARIRGVLLEDVLVLPREALREGDRVYALDEEDRLLVREVRVLRAERDRVVLRAEELAGARVVVSPLELVTDGMRVRDLGVDLGEASR